LRVIQPSGSSPAGILFGLDSQRVKIRERKEGIEMLQIFSLTFALCCVPVIDCLPKNIVECIRHDALYLVSLEFQTVSSSGSSLVPSRASSAAYASTASYIQGLSKGWLASGPCHTSCDIVQDYRNHDPVPRAQALPWQTAGFTPQHLAIQSGLVHTHGHEMCPTNSTDRLQHF
jgi:hypothetical protein